MKLIAECNISEQNHSEIDGRLDPTAEAGAKREVRTEKQ